MLHISVTMSLILQALPMQKMCILLRQALSLHNEQAVHFFASSPAWLYMTPEELLRRLLLCRCSPHTDSPLIMFTLMTLLRQMYIRTQPESLC